jgi:lactate dehydrogenase-like 2-hydroxyacid dehydrogenase
MADTRTGEDRGARGTDRPVVVVTRPNLFGDPITRLSAIADVRHWDQDVPPPAGTLATLAAEADAILCLNGDPVGRALFEASPRLRLVAIASVGYDSVDVAAAADHDVVVTNTPGVLSEAVADMVFGLMLAVRRRIVEGEHLVRSGGWDNTSLQLLVGADIHGTTLGIVGMGAIGRAVARRAQGFGIEILYTDEVDRAEPFGTRTTLDDLLARSDIVSLHVPLTPATRGLISDRELGLMKPTATLVNTSRGAVVDESALVRALRAGTIGSAALDVQAVEPNTDTANPLLAFPNVVITPHIASSSLSARLGMIDVAARNVESVLAGGAPITPVPGCGTGARRAGA